MLCTLPGSAQLNITKYPTGFDASQAKLYLDLHSSRFSPLSSRLDQVFDSLMLLSPVTGISIAMVFPDGNTWKRAGGIAQEIPLEEQLRPEHLMGMGSISKSFTAATILLLAEEGLLSLDDTLGKFFPPYPNIAPEVSIRQLLSHRSGIHDYLNENPQMGEDWIANLDSLWIVDTILNHYVLAPNFAPGASWSYSNTNFLLAGRIIEEVTEKAWYEVVREKVLTPLDLTHTYAYPWEKPVGEPFSHVWADTDGEETTVEDVQGQGIPLEGFFSLASSAGCLLTTAEDLARFTQALHGGKLLQAKSLLEMQTDYERNSSSETQYGLGVMSLPLDAGLTNWGHNGDIFYKAFAFYFPEIQLSIAVLQNDDRSIYTDPNILDMHTLFFALLETYRNTAISTSRKDLLRNSQVNIYPNPIKERLFITLEPGVEKFLPLTGEIVDVAGRCWKNFEVDSTQVEIEVDSLPTGVYVIKLGGLVQKVLVER